jgi:ketosteroid isomerase-like protein
MAKTAVNVAQDYLEAWNQHDVERIVALFTDDATVDLTPPPPGEEPHYEGKAAIRAWAMDEVGGFHVEPGEMQVDGDTVRFYAQVQSDETRKIGVDHLAMDAQIRVRGEQVAAFGIALTEGTLAKIQALMEAAQG